MKLVKHKIELNDGVFIIEGDKVRLRPELEEISIFKTIWQRDRGSAGDSQGRKKQRARQELSWIYHMVSHKSPYAKYSSKQRERSVTKAIFDEENWKPDDQIKEALNLYSELVTSPTIRLLNIAINGLGKSADYLDSFNFEKEDANGNPVYQPKTVGEIMKNLGAIGKMHESLTRLRDQVLKEEQENSNVRKGVQLNEFNE